LKDFKLLLIQANSPFDTLISPSIAILSAFVKKEGFQVKLFDTTFYKTREKTGDEARVETLQVKKTDFGKLGIFFNKTDLIEDFKQTIKEYKPDLIGLSTVSATHNIGIKLLNSIDGVPTIVGGIHTSICPEDTIKEKSVDMICIGEGEEALAELCNKMYKGEDIKHIKNLWVKEKEKIYKNPVRPLIDINDLPFQDWDIFEKRRRYKPMGGKIRITACIELNRGCPYNCTYCANEFWHKMYGQKHYREKNIQKFISEVKHLKKLYDIEYIYMSAETFLGTKKERFDEFIEEYSKIKIPFWMETRPETVTDEKIRKIKEVGCDAINIGIESGDTKLRSNLLNRKMKNEQIVNAVKIIKKYEIRIGTNNIIGFPGETRKQIFKTINLNREANPSNVMIYPFNPYHGTNLHNLCLEKGYISNNIEGGDYRLDYNLNQPQISKREVMGLYRTFAMYTKFSKAMWHKIKKAETDDKVFEELSKLYKELYL
jgi:radical SAM superfamily enzyme YgiQ (UPF0313 family)